MKTTKEMKKSIAEYFASLPNREKSPSCCLDKIGRKYVHFYSLCEGAKNYRYSIEYVYNNMIADMYM